MKRHIIIFLFCISIQFLITICAFGQVTFVASTPCSTTTRPVPGIPQGKSGCELIKWHLQFTGMGEKDNSGAYILDYDYGMSKQGTRGFINDGTHVHREGKWAVVKGTQANSSAIVYKLDPDKPAESISFMRLNENMLHLLDDHGHLMIGNGAWSYTLNRIKQ